MLRPAIAFALIPCSLYSLVLARLHSSLVPEDPYAFPKYRVSFLNGQPVLNETAQRWLQDGLKGGEFEFLDQPWESHLFQTPALKSIDSSSNDQDSVPSQLDHPEAPGLRLELMKMGPKHEFICLIPPPPLDPPTPVEEPTTDITPGHTWSLLQPLSGTCLYHKQGWFTYSYCHNSHVRQFHELANPTSQKPGEYRPEEDTEYEAYTLGRAPPTLDPSADLTVAEEAALAANVELARNSGSRYLVQRWSDGTYCEKIGRKREIEIQFHCSMTMTDSILFVKETQTCHYILHIATPRLCGEPGFKSRLDSREEAFIRCREVLESEAYENADRSLPPADIPFRMPKKVKAPVLPPPPPPVIPGLGGEDGKAGGGKRSQQHELIRKALEKILSGKGELKPGEVIIQPLDDGQEEVIIEFVDADLDDLDDLDDVEVIDLGEEAEGTEDGIPVGGGRGDASGRRKGSRKVPNLEEILKAAGHEVLAQRLAKSQSQPKAKAKSGSRHTDSQSDESQNEEESGSRKKQNTPGQGKVGLPVQPRDEL